MTWSTLGMLNVSSILQVHMTRWSLKHLSAWRSLVLREERVRKYQKSEGVSFMLCMPMEFPICACLELWMACRILCKWKCRIDCSKIIKLIVWIVHMPRMLYTVFTGFLYCLGTTRNRFWVLIPTNRYSMQWLMWKYMYCYWPGNKQGLGKPGKCLLCWLAARQSLSQYSGWSRLPGSKSSIALSWALPIYKSCNFLPTKLNWQG